MLVPIYQDDPQRIFMSWNIPEELGKNYWGFYDVTYEEWITALIYENLVDQQDEYMVSLDKKWKAKA